MAFMQVTALATAVTFLQTMEAAVHVPSVIQLFTAILIVVAVLRGLALRILVTQYPTGSGKLGQLVAAMQTGRVKGAEIAWKCRAPSRW